MHANQSSGATKTQTYSGNFFTSGVGILLMIVVAGCVWLTIANLKRNAPVNEHLLVAAILLMWWIGLGTNLYYFRIAGNYFEVRNDVLPWRWKKVNLDDLETVAVRIPASRRSDTLRFKTRIGDWSWGYSAGSLRAKNWDALAAALKRRGVDVRRQLERPVADSR